MDYPPKSELAGEKAAWRTRLLRSRAGLSVKQRASAGVKIRQSLMAMEAVSSASTVFCFISHGSEVDTHPLLRDLQASGKNILVPKIIRSEHMIAVLLRSWTDLRPGPLGILTPAGNDEWTDTVDVCITPGVGFTATGKRLGFGRGYYDRWFSGHVSGPRIAVAFECQIAPDLPADDHDVAVDMIVTERRVITI